MKVLLNSVALFLIGAIGFVLATLTYSVLVFSLRLEGSFALEIIKIGCLLPLIEEVNRANLVHPFILKAKVSAAPSGQVLRAMCLAIGWATCDLFAKTATNSEFNHGGFFGIEWLGNAQPFAMHLFYSTLMVFLGTRGLNIIASTLTVTLCHMFYNISAFLGENVRETAISVDDLVTILATVATIAILVATRNRDNKVPIATDTSL
jgi:hypothetical protein